jgi:hypothetical protein
MTFDLANPESRFILGLAEDLRGYVVLGSSILKYFGYQTIVELVKNPNLRDKLILSNDFSILLPNEELLVKESHGLKREAGHRNSFRELPYHLKKIGGEARRKKFNESNREIRKEIRILHKVKLLNRFVDEKYSGISEDLDELARVKMISSGTNVTLLTEEQEDIRRYVEIERGSQLKKRFELALLYPSDRSFSYFYPELVRSEKFADCFEVSEVA